MTSDGCLRASLICFLLMLLIFFLISLLPKRVGAEPVCIYGISGWECR